MLEALQDALSICGSTFSADEVQTWMNQKLEALDVYKAVNEAKELYENQKRSKARKWLTRLCSRIALYGQVLDVLAQHHPEYLALAWGSIKFVIQVSIQKAILEDVVTNSGREL
jgi:hypothetical protein